MLIKFILTLVMATITVSAGSLVWPRVTKIPEPPMLRQVHDIVIQTDIGRQANNVLGADTAVSQPINVQTVITNATNAIVSGVEDKAQQIVIDQAVKQILNQLDKLPQDQKQEIKDQLCKP